MKVTLFLLVLVVFNLLIVSSQKCCYPDQYETVIGLQGSFPGTGFIEGIQQVLVKHIYDFTNRRWAVVTQFSYYTGEEDAFYWIENHGENLISVLRDGKCYQDRLNATMRKSCIPENAEYRGQHITGGGSEQVMFDEWWYQTDIWNVTTQLAVQASGPCFPMNEIAIEDKPSFKAVIQHGYFNFTDKISDPTIFDVSEYCSDPIPMGNEIRPTGEYRWLRKKFYTPEES